MYNFPETLHPTPQQMFSDENLCYGFPEGGTIFYSRRDGNWNDISMWETVNGELRLPKAIDIVYVRHTVVANITASVKHLFVSGILKATNSAQTLSVLGNIQSVGNIDFTGSNINLVLYGVDNSIVNFISGLTSMFSYSSIYVNQPVMNLTYRNLVFSNPAQKYLTSDLVVNGYLQINGAYSGFPISTLELRSYNLTVNGSLNNFGTLSKFGGGNVLIKGQFFCQNILQFTGNPDVELQGGLNMSITTASGSTTGTGTWKFTTNNQKYSYVISNPTIFQAKILIDSGITLSLEGGGSRYYQPQFMQGINGVSSTSKLLCLDNSGVHFSSVADLSIIMPTGVFDLLTNNSILTYSLPVGTLLPYTTYKGLGILGNLSEIALSGNTSVSKVFGDANIGAYGLLNTGAYNLVSTGTSDNIYFKGTGKITSGAFNGCLFIGSNSVEATGGINIYYYSNGGSGAWVFSTNNQALAHGNPGGGGILTFNSNVLISGAISLTADYLPGPIAASTFLFLSALNGDNAASTYINKGMTHYQGVLQPMLTGKLDCVSGTNIFKYNLAGNQEVKGTTYDTLEFGGSGVKKLMGNVTVPTAKFSITGTATVDYNGYTITLT